jgi:Reverse transcriptase (RNA-dependent DNA polymerase)
MTQFNRNLSLAFEAYHTDRTNQFTLRKKQVNQEHLDIAEHMIESFRSDLNETWDENDTVDDKASKLDIAATNAYNEYCRKQSPVTAKQKHMTPELVDEVCRVHSMWRLVKVLGDKTGIQAWEKELRGFIQLSSENPRFGQLNENQTKLIVTQWEAWNKARKEIRIRINKARSEYYTKLIDECKGGNAANVWNTINIIAPRKFNSRQAMQKNNGEWCLEPEDVLEEIQTFAKNELKQVCETDFTPPPPPGPCEIDEEDEPTPMDVISGFRRTNPSKAGTGWSVPNELWVILEEEASPKVCDMWLQMGRQRVFPTSWQKQKCAWINKPGKRGKTINEKRGIMLSGSSSKAYSNWTQARTRRKMKGKWRQDCFGAIPGRGTTQALLKVFATRQQIKRAKKSTITFMGDGIKAFDRIDRRKVLDRVHREVNDHDLAWRHEVRHDKVLVVSEADDQQIVMAMADGVPQGDPNGPVLYVIGYSGVSEDIDNERASKGYEGLVFENGIGPPNQETDICRTTFVDDHKETHQIETEGKTVEQVKDEIRQRVMEITGNQAKWKVTNNMSKTVLLVELFGKGSRKLRKQIGSQIEIELGVTIKVVRSNKYLGVLVGGGDESTTAEITQRIKNSGEAVTRLRKFWKIKGIDTSVKVKAYEQLVRTILVYGIETRPVSKAQMTRLECFQTRILRRIGNSQSHITHESNEDIRQRLGVPSIDSFMTRVRLRMWQKLACNPIPSVFSALTGRMKGETKWGSTPHLTQLVRDLELLAECGGPKIAAKVAKNGKITIDLSTGGAVALLTKSQTQKVMVHTSNCENRPIKHGPLNVDKFVCDYAGCQDTFSDHHRLQTHRVRTHGYRDMYRNLVVDEFCPMCKSKFASKVGAMNHIQKVCGVKGTAEERDSKVRKIIYDRRVLSGDILPIVASLNSGASQPA